MKTVKVGTRRILSLFGLQLCEDFLSRVDNPAHGLNVERQEPGRPRVLLAMARNNIGSWAWIVRLRFAD
jgi:hypothetical protein